MIHTQPETRYFEFSVNLKNAKFKETEDGIEIYYTGDKLKEIGSEFYYSKSESSYKNPNNYSNESFTPSRLYSPDDYIKINLYR